DRVQVICPSGMPPAWGTVPYIGRFYSLCFALRAAVPDGKQDLRNPSLHCRQGLLGLECHRLDFLERVLKRLAVVLKLPDAVQRVFHALHDDRAARGSLLRHGYAAKPNL